MDARIKIDLTQGILEIEGSEIFVNEIYQNYKQNLSLIFQSKALEIKSNSSESVILKSKALRSDTPKNKRKNLQSSIKPPIIVKDLDLFRREKEKSLKSFIDDFLPPNNAMEWNLLFVYYLQKIQGVTGIGINHVYTCYKHLNVKPPTNIYQSLIDTKNRKGFINTNSIEDISVTMVGENHVEHEMKHKGETNGENK